MAARDDALQRIKVGFIKYKAVTGDTTPLVDYFCSAALDMLANARTAQQNGNSRAASAFASTARDFNHLSVRSRQ